MKKIIFCIVLFSLTGGMSFAQSEASGHDPKAKKVLDKVSAESKKLKSMNIVFKYTVENKQDDLSETNNGYAFMKGQSYKIILPGNEIISDGKTVWTIMSEAEEVTISEPGPESESIFNPAKLFTIYESGFKYRYLGEEGNKHVIDLYPENPAEKNYSRVRLKVDKSKHEIREIKTFRKDGYTYTISVTQFKKNHNLPDDMFGFKKENYKDYSVIDMR